MGRRDNERRGAIGAPRGPWAAWVVGLAVACAGIGAVDVVADREEASQAAVDTERFEARGDQVVSQVQQGIATYAEVLAGAARFQSLRRPSRAEWAAYGAGGLLDGLPGVRSLAFVQRVAAGELDAFLAEQRADGAPGFELHSQGEAAEYCVVTGSTPVPPTSLGLDLCGASERREAFDQARDTGEAAVTAPFILVADQALPEADRLPAVGIYAPVYRAGAPTVTTEDRRAALVGWTVLAVRGQDFLDAIGVGAAVGVELLDGAPGAGRSFATSMPQQAGAARFERDVAVELLGRTWTVRTWAPSAFAEGPGTGAVRGLGSTAALLAGVAATGSLSRRRRTRAAVAAALAGAAVAERALRNVEATQRASLDALEQGVALSDPDGRVLLLNRAAQEILGYDAAALTERFQSGRWVSYDEHGAVLPPERRPLGHTMRTGEAVRGAIVGWRTSGGDLRILRLSTEPVAGPDGRAGIVTAFFDITAERAAERERAELEARFSLAFGATALGMALVDPASRLLEVNDAFCTMLGRSKAELVGHHLRELNHPDDQSLVEAQLAEVERGAVDSFRLEKRLLRPDGTTIVVSQNSRVVRDADGSPLLYVVALEDITTARAAAEALRATEQRFAALVERSTDVICVVDRRGRVTYLSPAGYRLLGISELGDLTQQFSAAVHPEDLGVLTRTFEELLASPGAVRTAQYRLRRADGSWSHVEIVAANRLDDPNVRGLVGNIRDVTERAEAAARLAWQAFHDGLTGLPNRSLLLDRLEHALDRAARTGELVGLLYVDLDRFKLVNDTMGHDAGDLLLVEVARRLRRVVRAADTVARQGGDEFVVLAESLDSAAELQEIAARIREVIAEPVRLPLGPVAISASIGVAFANGNEGSSVLRDADTALYRAKERGKDRVEVFDDALRLEAMHRLSTERILRRALDEDGLVVHYQPIVDLITGAVVGAEALLRIPGPNGELQSPQEFIAVAEECGLIEAVGAGVLDEACRTLAAWQQERTDAPRYVAVNVSPGQLGKPGFADLVARTLARHGLEPQHLVLEFTEQTVLGADDSTAREVAKLHDLGIPLAIDDFGTGYSSLAYLKRFPIDIVKLDRTFVDGLGSDPSDTAIVRAVIGLGRSLGLVVVAEGIETPEQLGDLQALGCDLGQGFFLATPAAASDLRTQVSFGSSASVLPR